MDDCLFCKIIRGEIPSAKVYEDDDVYAFRDIHPMAPVHVLVVPKTHVSGMSAVDALSDAALAACLRACRTIAEQEGIHRADTASYPTAAAMPARVSLICTSMFWAASP